MAGIARPSRPRDRRGERTIETSDSDQASGSISYLDLLHQRRVDRDGSDDRAEDICHVALYSPGEPTILGGVPQHSPQAFDRASGCIQIVGGSPARKGSIQMTRIGALVGVKKRPPGRDQQLPCSLRLTTVNQHDREPSPRRVKFIDQFQAIGSRRESPGQGRSLMVERQGIVDGQIRGGQVPGMQKRLTKLPQGILVIRVDTPALRQIGGGFGDERSRLTSLTVSKSSTASIRWRTPEPGTYQ